MRIGVILCHLPLAEGSAAGRCGLALVRGLREQGHDLTILAADTEGRAQDIPDDVVVETMRVSYGDPGWADRARRWTKPGTNLTRGAFADRARELSSGVDAVFLDEVDAAPLASLLQAPALAHLHYWSSRDRKLGPPWSAYARDSVLLRRADRRAAKRNAHVAGCSQEIVSDLLRSGAADAHLTRLGLDPSFYEPATPVDDPIIGMIGSADWPPTNDAVRVLLAEVWPKIRAASPEAVLRLAGRGMVPESFPDLPSAEGLEWLGEVESAADFLRSLALQIYPLTRGSGTKVKLLESLFLGIPVVTTPTGLEGIQPNEGIVTATGFTAIADATVRLLDDQKDRARRGQAAVSYAQQQHSPLAVSALVSAALAEIV